MILISSISILYILHGKSIIRVVSLFESSFKRNEALEILESINSIE
jgi:hypothetical protein